MPGHSKGQIRIIEAFFSMLIIFSALAVCSFLSSLPEEMDDRSLTSNGIQVLIQLDRLDVLERMIEQGNWIVLSENLHLLLPLGVSYNLTVYNENMQQVNDEPVCRGHLDGNVVTVEYLCVSRDLQYNSYMLRLQLATVR